MRVRGAAGDGVPLAEIARARADAKLANTFDGYFDADVPAYKVSVGRGEPYAMYVTGTQMAEVEVDTATGAVRVLRVVAAHDVGRPAFVEGVVGQIEGGIAMGVGFALTEEFVPGRDHGLQAVPDPAHAGHARDGHDPRRRGAGEPAEPPELQLKGVAECSNMVVAPAIANAIAHATGQRVVQLPADRRPRRASARVEDADDDERDERRDGGER